MTQKNKIKETNNFFGNLWGSIFLILILLVIAVSIGYGIGYKDGKIETQITANQEIRQLENYCETEYKRISNKYNDLVDEYNEQNQKITVYQNGLLSCGIDFNNLLN